MILSGLVLLLKKYKGECMNYITIVSSRIKIVECVTLR